MFTLNCNAACTAASSVPVKECISPKAISMAMNRFVVGGVVGAFASTVTAPLDVVKTTLQNGGRSSVGYEVPRAAMARREAGKISQVLKSVVREQGVKGCFRGLGLTLMGIIPTTSTYFGVYDYSRRVMERQGFGPTSMAIGSSMTAGIFTQVVTNPLWLVKTRMQTGNVSVNALTMTRDIFRQEGARGFFKGLSAGVMGASQYVVQFPIYELMLHNCTNGGDRRPSGLEVAAASAGSKTIASLITYPQQVLRTRLQSGAHSGRLMHLVADTIRREGLAFMYKGMTANLLKTVPTSVMTLCAFEYFAKRSH